MNPIKNITGDAHQQKSQYRFRNTTIGRQIKVLLTRHSLSPYSFMLLTVLREKEAKFVADIAFLSSDSGDTKDISSIKEGDLADLIGKYPLRKFKIRGRSRFFMEVTLNTDQKGQPQNNGDLVADIAFLSSDSGDTKDISSIKEGDLADLTKMYRVFVECIKTAEQKELSKRSRNTFQRLNFGSIIRQIAKGMNTGQMKKAMITNGLYVKNATLSTVKIRKIIYEFKELQNRAVKRDIYTKINVGGSLIVTRSTIELDADIVSVIQKEPAVRNLAIKNFILNIHMSNVSLFTFFSLNRMNEIFANCGMIIGFSRMATTPVSIYNMFFISLDPFSIAAVAVPTAFVVFMPRIARIMIRYKIKKSKLFRK